MKSLTFLASLLGLISCAPPLSQDAAALAAITRAVKESLATGGGALRAGRAIPGEWDRAEVVGPYTPAEALEAKVGPDARVKSAGIEARDDITLIILLREKSIQSVVEFPRATADFSPLAGTSLKPDDCLQIRAGQPPLVERGSGC